MQCAWRHEVIAYYTFLNNTLIHLLNTSIVYHPPYLYQPPSCILVLLTYLYLLSLHYSYSCEILFQKWTMKRDHWKWIVHTRKTSTLSALRIWIILLCLIHNVWVSMDLSLYNLISQTSEIAALECWWLNVLILLQFAAIEHVLVSACHVVLCTVEG